MRTQSDSDHEHNRDLYGLPAIGRQALIGLMMVALFAFGFFRANLRAGLKVSDGALLKFIDNPDLQVKVESEEWLKEASTVVDFRLERERERSRLQERLEELFSTASEETAKEIHKELRDLAEKSAMEHELENFLRARGYHEVAVAIYPRGITVVIKDGNLSEQTVSTVGRLVADLAQCPLEEIRIME